MMMLDKLVRFLSYIWALVTGHNNEQLRQNIRRPLSPSEVFFLELQELGECIVAYIFFVSSQNKVTEREVKPCLMHLMNIHPLLRMCVIQHRGQYYWSEPDNPKPEVRVEQSRDWNAVFARTVSEKFDDVTKGPLWSLTLMPNVTSQYQIDKFRYHSAFLFRFHHSTIDGQGLIALMNDLQDLLVAGNVESLERPLSLEIPKSMDDHAYTRMTWIQKILYHTWIARTKWLRHRLMMKTIAKMPNPYVKHVGLVSDHHDQGNVEPQACIYPTVLNSKQFQMIYKACKANDVTVQCVIQAASTIALCEIMKEGVRQHETDAPCLEAKEADSACLEANKADGVCLEAKEADSACLEANKADGACLEAKHAHCACPEAKEANGACLEVNEAGGACLEADEAHGACLEADEANGACLEANEADSACLEVNEADNVCPEATEADGAYLQAMEANGACLEVNEAGGVCLQADEAGGACLEANGAFVEGNEPGGACLEAEEANGACLEANESDSACLEANKADGACLEVNEADSECLEATDTDISSLEAKETNGAGLEANEADSVRLEATGTESSSLEAKEVSGACMKANEADRACLKAKEGDGACQSDITIKGHTKNAQQLKAEYYHRRIVHDQSGTDGPNADEFEIQVAAQARKHFPDSEFADSSSYVVEHVWSIGDKLNMHDWTNQDQFWVLAKRNKEHIQDNKLPCMAVFPLMLKFCRGLFPTIPPHRYSMIGFTNHGNCNYLNRNPDSSLKIAALFSGVGQIKFGGIYNHYITTLDDQMFWGVNYCTNVTTREQVRDYLQRSVTILLDACREET